MYRHTDVLILYITSDKDTMWNAKKVYYSVCVCVCAVMCVCVMLRA